MENSYFTEMKRCKTDWLDDIFYGTKESKGTRNAVGAIKLVLFDDYSVVPDGVDIGDKYEFISSKFDGRAKAKMLQPIDLIQILCDYAMRSFALQETSFIIDEEIYKPFRKGKVSNKGYDKRFIIELVAYALMNNIFEGYILVSSNKFIKEELLDSLIEERYIENKEQELNRADGILIDPKVPEKQKKQFREAFKKLDEDFLKIKKRDSEYVKFEEKIK